MLGLVVAKVSGKSFGDFLRERIFAPLQMNSTLAYERGKNEVANRAYGHSREGDAWKQTDQSSTSATLGDGGVYSSLADLAKWDDALAHHTLLSESEMQRCAYSCEACRWCAAEVAARFGSACRDAGGVWLWLVSRSVSRARAHVALRRYARISYLHRTVRR